MSLTGTSGRTAVTSNRRAITTATRRTFTRTFWPLARRNGLPREIHLEEKLTALLDHLMYLTKPDGTTPLFGDDDGGRLVKLDQSEPTIFARRFPRARRFSDAAITNTSRAGRRRRPCGTGAGRVA